jgi:hypothetical protein
MHKYLQPDLKLTSDIQRVKMKLMPEIIKIDWIVGIKNTQAWAFFGISCCSDGRRLQTC